MSHRKARGAIATLVEITEDESMITLPGRLYDSCNDICRGLRRPHLVTVFLHRQDGSLLKVPSEFIEATAFDHEVPCPEIERQHFVARVFDGDAVGISELVTDPHPGLWFVAP